MTVRELMVAADAQPLWLQFVALAIPVVFTFFCSLFHQPEDGNQWPWKYVYSLIIFVVYVPGVFSVVLIGYSIAFVSENLLDSNLLFVFGPLASMVSTVQVMKWKRVNIDRLPGFTRLLGFSMMIGSAGVGALLVQRSRIWVMATLADVFKVFLLLLAVMYAGYYRMFCRDDPEARAF